MNLIERNKSIITYKENLEFLYKFESFPVFIGCTDTPIEDDILSDMTWMICRDSGMIQLKNLLPLDIVYSKYHSEGIGAIWELHHHKLSNFIRKHTSGNILEIGGSNGSLAEKFYENNLGAPNSWTIVEPNPSFKGNGKIHVIKAFFNENIYISDINTIVHSHVLEHIIDPNVTLRHIHQLLPINGKHIFSVPNLYAYLKHKYSNSINFEHTYFLSEYFTDYLLKKHGFDIIEKYYFQEHSIFYVTKKSKNIVNLKLTNHYKENKKLYLEMIDHYDIEVNKLNHLMDDFKGKIFLFGAHIFSQFLLYRGLNSKKIINIIDNSSLKHNKRLYGTNINVVDPSIIDGLSEVAVILKAGQYQDEVRAQLKNINPKVTIWE